MSSDKSVELKQEFGGEKSTDQDKANEVPERIKNHAPVPTLKPEGSWKARADAVDKAVRENVEAQKAKNEWAKRLKNSKSRGKGYKMRRGS